MMTPQELRTRAIERWSGYKRREFTVDTERVQFLMLNSLERHALMVGCEILLKRDVEPWVKARPIISEMHARATDRLFALDVDIKAIIKAGNGDNSSKQARLKQKFERRMKQFEEMNEIILIPRGSHAMRDMKRWCKISFSDDGRYFISRPEPDHRGGQLHVCLFKDGRDAMMFKLAWG